MCFNVGLPGWACCTSRRWGKGHISIASVSAVLGLENSSRLLP